MNHELIIKFAPKEDEEAKRIITAVDALGFEIVGAIQIKSTLGAEAQRSRGATFSGDHRIRQSVPLSSCTFCGKEDLEVKALVAGPVTYICDECVDLCVEIIGQDDAN